MCRAREAVGVTEDATLDQFASGGSDDATDPDAADEQEGGGGPEREQAADEPARGGEAGEPERGGDAAVEPAVSTYRFAPDGRACADCGGSVTRLWRDGDALVCPDCKQWQE